jgi:hypothetical protein
VYYREKLALKQLFCVAATQETCVQGALHAESLPAGRLDNDNLEESQR